MKRLALLIGAVGTGTPLPGVAADLANYRAYLMSRTGGAWFDSEILVMEEPSSFELELGLAGTGDTEFSLVVFAGHGQTREGETYVFLKDGEREAGLLNTSAGRQLVVVDACRSPAEESSDLWVKVAQHGLESTANKAAARARYTDALRRADPGKSVLFSCAVGQSAGDTRTGGEFSKRLIRKAFEWGDQGGPGDVPQVMSIVEAHASVEREMRDARLPQRPELENGRRQVSFPWAIR